MKKSLGLSCLALAGLFALTGCSVSEKDGKAWAEANGYIKYEDSHTSSSIKPSSYTGLYEEKDALVAAMAQGTHGTYLHVTLNQDGTTNVAYFIFSVKKNDTTGKYEITQSFGVNTDGTPNQTTANLLRTGKGSAVWISHSYNEIVGTASYSAVTGEVAPEFKVETYYSENGGRYTLLQEAPADWATNYTNYYTVSYSDVHPKDLKLPADKNTAYAAQMNYHVKEKTETKDNNGKVTGYRFVLEVDSFERVS